MSKIKRIGASRVAIATMAAVLAASGAAVAATGNSDTNSGQQGGPPAGQRGPGGPGGGPNGGPGGLQAKYLTYSETHTYKRGKETVVRTDAGKITSVSDTSITVSERDGNSVTRELDADTDFRVQGNQNATAADLAVGDSVIISGEKDAAADVVGKR